MASAAVIVTLLVVGLYGTMAGALVGLTEAARVPAIVVGVAFFCLRHGAAGLREVAPWCVAGLAAAFGLRSAVSAMGGGIWLPSTQEDPGPPDILLDTAWLCALSALAIRRHPVVSGPMIAAIIATTRIGAFVDIPAAMLREAATSDVHGWTLAAFAVQVIAGVLAAGLVIIGSSWMLFLLSRLAQGLAAPTIVLGLVGLIAALARAWPMLNV